MNLPKQDRSTSRTTTDIERKYGKKVTDTKKEVESQSKDLASLNADVAKLIKKIETINNRIVEIDQKYEELDVIINSINYQVKENTELSHSHTNKGILDEITQDDIDNWNNPIKYLVGDIYLTTDTKSPDERLGYGTWENISTQEVSEEYICYMWIRIE